jgi:hypothetical protein
MLLGFGGVDLIKSHRDDSGVASKSWHRPIFVAGA